MLFRLEYNANAFSTDMIQRHAESGKVQRLYRLAILYIVDYTVCHVVFFECLITVFFVGNSDYPTMHLKKLCTIQTDAY